MSNRERWVIYPLLFFAIIMAGKTQFDQLLLLETELIQCRELNIVDRQGRVQLKLTSDRHGGVLALVDDQNAPSVVLNSDEDGGRLRVAAARNPGAVELRGSSSGGQLRLSAAPGTVGAQQILLGFPPDAPPGLSAQRDGQLWTHDDAPWGVTMPAN